MKNILFKILVACATFFGSAFFIMMAIWWTGNQKTVINLFLLAKGSRWHVVQGGVHVSLQHRYIILTMNDLLLAEKHTYNSLSIADFSFSYSLDTYRYNVMVKRFGGRFYQGFGGRGVSSVALTPDKMLSQLKDALVQSHLSHAILIDGHMSFYAFKERLEAMRHKDKVSDLGMKPLMMLDDINLSIAGQGEEKVIQGSSIFSTESSHKPQYISVYAKIPQDVNIVKGEEGARVLAKFSHIPLAILSYFRSDVGHQVEAVRRAQHVFFDAAVIQHNHFIDTRASILATTFVSRYDQVRDKGFFSLNVRRLDRLLPVLRGGDDGKDRISVPIVIGGGFSVKKFSLHGEAVLKGGGVTLSPYFPKTFKIKEGRVTFSMDRRFFVHIKSSLRLLKNTVISTNVALRYRPEGDINISDVSLNVLINTVPLDQLGLVWPHTLAVDSRLWVTGNLSKGSVSGVTLNYQTNRDGKLIKFGGEMHVKGAHVDYTHPLPPANGVDADITYDTKGLFIKITKGKVLHVNVPSTLKILYHPHKDLFTMDINIYPTGSAQDLLKVIDHKPLNLIHDMGEGDDFINKTNGVVDGKLWLSFPLHNLTPDKIKVKANARISYVETEVLGRSFTSPSMVLSVDRSGMSLGGDGRIADNIPLSFQWKENFSSHSLYSRIIQANVKIPMADNAFISVNKPYIAAGITVKRDQNHITHIAINSDLTNMRVDVPLLGFIKKENVPLSLDIAMKGDSLGYIADNVSLRGRDVDVSGMFYINPQSELQRFKLDHINFMGNKGDLDVKKSEGRYHVNFGLDKLYLTEVKRAFGGGNDKKSSQSSWWHDFTKNITLHATISSLYGYKGALAYKDLLADWKVTHNINDYIHFNMANRDGSSAVAIAYDPLEGGYRKLDVVMSSLGGLLKNTGIADDVTGGELKIDGIQHTQIEPLNGSIVLKSYSPVNIPVLVNLLKVVSIMGIFDAFSSKLYFDVLHAKYSYYDHVLTIKKGYTYGLSTGMTVHGTINLLKNKLDLKGGIVPAFFFNRAIAAVPLLGKILAGDDQEGLFTANYSITGALDNPVVNVNPLTMVLPGVIRNLFSSIF